MKQLTTVLIVVLVLILSACGEWVTPTPAPTAEGTATATLAPSPTPAPVLVLGPELLTNPGLQVDQNVTPQDGLGGNLRVADGWRIAYNPSPNEHPCEEGQTINCNPPESLSGEYKPEAKPADLSFPFSLYPEPGQQWFCWEKVCDVALGQPVATIEGQLCEIEVQVLDYQPASWYDGYSIPPDTSGYQSNWYLDITPVGFTPWGTTTPQQIDHWTGWDDVVVRRAEFVATGNDMLWIRNARGYPIRHQESIIYNASVRCWEEQIVTEPTPTPTAEPTDTPLPTPTPIAGTPGPLDCDNLEYSLYADVGRPQWKSLTDQLRIRTCPTTEGSTYTGYWLSYGQEITVYGEWQDAAGEWWLLVPYGANHFGWVAHIHEGKTFGCWSDRC